MVVDASEKRFREDSIEKIESEVTLNLSTLKASGKKLKDEQLELTDQDIGKYLRDVQRTVYKRLNPNEHKKRREPSHMNFASLLNKSQEGGRRHSIKVHKREHGHSFKFKRELATLVASKHKSMISDVS